MRKPAVLLGVLLLLVFAGLAACGGDDDDAGATGAGDDTNSSSGTAPTPSAADLEELIALKVPGFTSSDGRLTPLGATVLYTSDAANASGAKVLVLVNAASCDSFACTKLDPAQYETAEAQGTLKSTLPSIHIENPALKWDFGQVELAPGKKGLFTYAVSYVETKDASGGTSRASANSYRAWYHDGGTFISLEVFSRGGDSVRSAEDLLTRMSRAEAEKAAKDVFAAFAPRFSN